MPLNQIRGLLGDCSQSTSTIHSTVTRPINDNLSAACMDVNACMDGGTYICTEYNPRCFLLQKVN